MCYVINSVKATHLAGTMLDQPPTGPPQKSFSNKVANWLSVQYCEVKRTELHNTAKRMETVSLMHISEHNLQGNELEL